MDKYSTKDSVKGWAIIIFVILLIWGAYEACNYTSESSNTSVTEDVVKPPTEEEVQAENPSELEKKNGQNSKVQYEIIGTMAAEGCPNCIDVMVNENISNEEIKRIIEELIAMKGTKKLMVDFFTSKSDYKNHKSNGPYFANYMSFEEDSRTRHYLMFHDGSEIEL